MPEAVGSKLAISKLWHVGRGAAISASSSGRWDRGQTPHVTTMDDTTRKAWYRMRWGDMAQDTVPQRRLVGMLTRGLRKPISAGTAPHPLDPSFVGEQNTHASQGCRARLRAEVSSLEGGVSLRHDQERVEDERAVPLDALPLSGGPWWWHTPA